MGVAGVIAGVFVGLNKFVQKASELQETNNKFHTVFAGVTKDANEMVETLGDAYLMSNRESKELLSNTGDLLNGFNFTKKESADLSFEVQKLAADLSSYNNFSEGAAGASEIITKAMLGERDALVSLNTKISEKALAERVALKRGKNLTEQEKIKARALETLNMITEQNANAIGDVARSEGSYVHTKKAAAKATEDFAAKMGSVFIPIWNKVLQGFLEFLKIVKPEDIAGTLFAAWEVFKDFGTRLWGLFSNLGTLLYDLVTGNWDELGASIDGLWASIGKGWDDTVKNIVAARNEGVQAVKDFTEGEKQDALDKVKVLGDAEKEITAEQLKQIEKRKQAEKDYWDEIKTNIEDYKESKAQEFDDTIVKENSKLDYMYQSNRLSHDDYLQIMANRIETARVLYGEESLEYMQLVDQKLDYEKEYQKKKQSVETTARNNTIGIMSGLMGAANGVSRELFAVGKAAAYAQAIVDTYAAANKALLLPPPWGEIQAGARIAMGLLNVKKIADTKFEKRAKGGYLGTEIRTLVKSNFGCGENRLIIANDKEFIVNAEATQANRGLLEMINRTNQRVNIAQAGGSIGSTGSTNTNVNAIVDSAELVEAIENIKIDIHSTMDYMKFYRNTFKKYEDNEKSRRVG